MRHKRWLLSAGLLISVVAARSDVLVGPLFPVRDIYPGTTPVSNSLPNLLTEYGGRLYFSASSGSSGGLWKSDGTPEGTALAIAIGTGSLSVFKGLLYILSGFQLYGSDGTASGTFLVKDFENESGGPGGLYPFGGRLYFANRHSLSQGTFRLWASDGTEAGTVIVKEFLGGIQIVGGAGQYFYFFAGAGLWRTDGTESGTVLLKDSLSLPSPFRIAALGDSLYFVASGGSFGSQLWRSDGTPSGTLLVRDIQTQLGASSNLNDLTEFNGELYFTAYDGTGRAIWKTDGTETGTRMVVAAAGTELTKAGTSLYFSGPSALWKSDGTQAGTAILKSFPISSAASNLKAIGSNLFFVAYDTNAGNELWRTDGTAAGTILLKDIWPGTTSSSPSNLTEAMGLLFFSASDPVHGKELWRTDGTSAGTVLLDLNPGFGASKPEFLGEFKGRLYFGADDGVHGPELWRSDGTETGTVLVKDILPGSEGSNPFNFAAVDDLLFFLASNSGVKLYKTDGTSSGTIALHDFTFWGAFMGNVGGRLILVADDGTTGWELWTSDGTPAGTRVVKDLASGRSSPFSTLNPNLFAVSRGLLFFTANADGNPYRRELYRTDGTAAGTSLVKTINSFTDAFPFALADVNGTLFFFADDFTHGYELWKSDGTEAGTVLVKDINPGRIGSTVEDGFTRIVASNGTAFFRAYDDAHGYELWKSDGTAAGTVLVKDIASGPAHSFPFRPCAAGGLVYFYAEGDAGSGLWRSDGTEAGTIFLAPVFPDEMIDGGGSLVFRASDFLHGSEVWISDGTVAGTRILADVAPGPTSFNPGGFTRVGDHIFLHGDDGRIGEELWAFRVAGRDLASPGNRLSRPLPPRPRP